jgi:hypothetical protein
MRLLSDMSILALFITRKPQIPHIYKYLFLYNFIVFLIPSSKRRFGWMPNLLAMLISNYFCGIPLKKYI